MHLPTNPHHPNTHPQILYAPPLSGATAKLPEQAPQPELPSEQGAGAQMTTGLVAKGGEWAGSWGGVATFWGAAGNALIAEVSFP